MFNVPFFICYIVYYILYSLKWVLKTSFGVLPRLTFAYIVNEISNVANYRMQSLCVFLRHEA